MIDIITTIAKYLIIIMCLIYTLSCYTVFRPKNRDRKEDLLDNQVIYMFVFLFLCYTVLFLQEFELKILIFFAAQVIFFEILMIVFPRIYKRCSRPLINNTCFLLGVGFVILTRLSFDLAMKQFAIAAGSVIVTSFIPLMMHKITIWNKLDGFMQWQDFYYCLQYSCLVSTSMGRITGSALRDLNFSLLNL